MNQITKIEIPVGPETAVLLEDPRRRAAVGHLIDRIIQPSAQNDPLIDLLRATAVEAAQQGLTEEESTPNWPSITLSDAGAN